MFLFWCSSSSLTCIFFIYICQVQVEEAQVAKVQVEADLEISKVQVAEEAKESKVQEKFKYKGQKFRWKKTLKN